MKLYQALDVSRGDVVAFIGAGGKTSALVRLGYELAEAGWRVLATTTTRIAEDQLSFFPQVMPCTANASAISTALTANQFIFLYDHVRNGKVYGPSPDWLPTLLDGVDSDVLLIEADGARGLPFKAPFDHEPVIPIDTSLVVPIASLNVLGDPLDDEHVYNPDAMINRFGYVHGSRVRSPWIADVMSDKQLGLRGVPDKARVVAYLNQTPETGYLRGRARLIARLMLRSEQIRGVAIGSIRSAEPVHEIRRPVGAIVLAAGMSTRMGDSKVLLPWTEHKTIIEHIVDQLIRSRLDYITVVTGHRADEVKRLVKPMGAKVIYNRAYKTGEMLSSLKAGLRAMPDFVTAALVVLGDQPRIQPRVVYQVMNTYAEGKSDLVAPSYEMRRGHPILIGRRYWPDILALRGDSAPRDVLNRHKDRIVYVDVDTDSILRDVDTPQDYEQERHRAGLRRIRPRSKSDDTY